MSDNHLHNITRRRWFVTLAVTSATLLVMRGGHAAPPDFSLVPADVRWLVHGDIDALQRSTAYQRVFKKLFVQWKPLAAHLDKVNRQYGMDLAKDLHSLTFFGPRLSQGGAVLLLRADWAPETFRRKLALAPEYAMAVEDGYEIHRFAQKDRGHVRPLAGAFWKEDVFVFGQTADEVKLSLAVLDGKKPALSGRGPLLAAAVPPGTILVARMIGVGDSLLVESPLLMQTEQIDFVCGENGGECFIHAKLLARSPEAAQRAKQVADGLLAMARLRQAGDADALKLLARIELRVDQQTVGLDFQAPADDVARCLEAAIEKLSQDHEK